LLEPDGLAVRRTASREIDSPAESRCDRFMNSSGALECVVVGGSLVGLSAAIALSRLGINVTVLERSPSRAVDGGGGLGVDVALLQQVTGIGGEPPVVHGIDRDTTAWHLLQGWLEDHALLRHGVTMHRGTEVTSAQAGNDRRARVATADGGGYEADLLIGADGARSTVRAAVAPEDPAARYAGVLLWRALVDEQALPDDVPRLRPDEPSREVYAGPYRLVIYLVPGRAGETGVGQRRLNLVWYDPEQGDLLRHLGVLEGETVHGSMAPGAMPAPVRERLAAFAAANWPSPWREALALALASGTVFGTPIVHYEPRRLASGRAALAGDSAHAASPMVGGGFRQGLYDVAALAQVMAELTPSAAVSDALARYEELRLRPAVRHVMVSEQATAAYLDHAASR
jgi:2-polyprenyl-6-methoxyphenol hydroxylase-like FAD-dependent oxidoreductase